MAAVGQLFSVGAFGVVNFALTEFHDETFTFLETCVIQSFKVSNRIFRMLKIEVYKWKTKLKNTN